MGLNWARVGRIVALRMDRMVGGREGRVRRIGFVFISDWDGGSSRI